MCAICHPRLRPRVDVTPGPYDEKNPRLAKQNICPNCLKTDIGGKNRGSNITMINYSIPVNDSQRLMIRCLLLLIFFLNASIVNAGDAKVGKQKSVACAACHGSKGISVHPTWPDLAGQDAQYIASQLKAFRDGVRKSAMMYPMTFDLNDKDIDDIAAYYSQLKCN